MNIQLNIPRRSTVAAILCGACVIIATSDIRAAGQAASYDLRFGTDLDLLKNPDDHHAQMMAAWKTPEAVEILRNVPTILLTNTSTEDCEITNFRLQLMYLDSVFDDIISLEMPDGLILPLKNNLSPVLDLSFADRPLQVGESIAFMLDLDPAPGAPQVVADFRTTFWDQDEDQREDNAIVEVTFDFDPAHSPKPVPLYEFPFEDALFDTRPVDQAAGESMMLPAMMGHNDLGVFQFVQGVPEPSTAGLLAMGLLSLLARGGRKRQRTAPATRTDKP